MMLKSVSIGSIGTQRPTQLFTAVAPHVSTSMSTPRLASGITSFARSPAGRAHFLTALRASSDTTPTVAEAPEATTAASSDASAADVVALTPVLKEELPLGALTFQPRDQWWTSFRLAFALPWRRVKQGSVLAFKLEGDISDQSRSWLDPNTSVPQLCSALRNAAHDPRVSGICMEVAPLAIGWAKVQEIRRHLEYFRASGKFTISLMKTGGEKEYYLASACNEIYVPPTAGVSMRGFAVSGTFLRGVLDKVGVEPQVQRIGKFKSAGDQILRKDMSDAQRQQLDELLQDIYQDFITTVASARGKTPEDVSAMLNEGIFEMEDLVKQGFVTALKYEDEIIEDLKKRTGGKEDELRKVSLKRYSRVPPRALGFKGKKVIAVLRSAGAILNGKGTGTGAQITPDALIAQLRALAKNKKVDAVVLRVDSPGGDALASDLMWREIQQLAKIKPVVASMGDVAASGGYYLSMAASKIVAEPLTITGSIGVVTGKFNLAELFQKVGYSKTILSRGRYAELLADSRPFSPDEQELFERSAQHAYRSFRDKAALSRGMSIEDMQEVAQGRVWSGVRAVERGLVDAIGGVNRAIAIAKQAASIPQEDEVTVLELGQAKSNILSIIGGGASASMDPTLCTMLSQVLPPQLAAAAAAAVGSPAATAALLQLAQPGRLSYTMTDVDAASMGCSTSGAVGSSSIDGASAPSSGEGFLAGVGQEGEDVWDSGVVGVAVGVVDGWLREAF